MTKISLTKEVNEIKNQLAYAKNIGFFFGAGASCALKIPNVDQLTSAIEAALTGDLKANFILIKTDLEATNVGRHINIEDILNQIRRIREITGESDNDYIKVSGKSAKALDKEICTIIYNIILEKEKTADLQNPKRFFAWLNILNREYFKRGLYNQLRSYN